MNELINGLDGIITYLGIPGLIVIFILVFLYKKRKKDEEAELEEIERKKELRRKKAKLKKENTVIVTETKTTKIKNLKENSYEKINSRDISRHINNDID